MSRRRDDWIHDERVLDSTALTQPIPPGPAQRRASQAPPLRHCWVIAEHGRLPALLLEWRRAVSGWQGRVVRPVLEGGCWVVVEEWLPANTLQAAE